MSYKFYFIFQNFYIDSFLVYSWDLYYYSSFDQLLKKIGCFPKHISENDLFSIILYTLAGHMILESGVLTHFSKNSRDTSPF